MTLLLQLNGDLPEHFPGHERRLYLFSCRKRTCRRKDGSVRAFRGIRVNSIEEKTKSKDQGSDASKENEQKPSKPQQSIGDNLFGSKGTPTTNTNLNPFSPSAATQNPFSTPPNPNPFSSNPTSLPPPSSLASKPPQRPTTEDLPATFASKARISTPPPSAPSTTQDPDPEPWPPQTSFPPAYPTYHLDADYETISKPPTPPIPTQTIDIDDPSPATTKNSGQDIDPSPFESSLDKTFLRFSDRLAQNPLQTLRYEFRGTPLLYSKTDAVGKLFSPASQSQSPSSQKITTLAHSDQDNRIPRCGNCSAQRVFELQLTPHAIAELEVEEMGLEGMDWGTIILGVCEKDCQREGVLGDGVGYVEEWVGVQWEDLRR